jgi:hypothetical protein
MIEHWWIILAVVMLAVLAAASWLPIRVGVGLGRFREARRDFHRHRERLEAKFVQLGSIATRRDCPRWTDVDFDDDVSYARNRATGELSAFVAVTIELEDPDDQSLAALDASELADENRRAATAVFRFDNGHWDTDGRALFNLSPAQAIRFYHHELELLGQEVGKQF